jgi:hypothetical protein
MSLKAKNAEVAQLVERNLAKVEVAGSSLVFRSIEFHPPLVDGIFYLRHRDLTDGPKNALTWVAELVDALDLKSSDPQRSYGFNSRPGYNPFQIVDNQQIERDFLFCSCPVSCLFSILRPAAISLPLLP